MIKINLFEVCMKKGKILTTNWFYYLVITIYALMLIFISLDFNFNNLYGSTIDWLSQHSVIPEYFRQSFYETGNLVPNLAFNLGGGQNIFNYSYYGLLSPIVLVSYLLPFIDMTTYTCLSSIILYILTGILFYKFSTNNKLDRTLSLFLSLALITISPVSYHFHHHIMFVDYLPFLILSLIGVDKYLENKKSFLLIIATFLVIMTNYYYSVCCLLVIFVYGIYKILDRKWENIKNLIKNIFYLLIRVLTSILMACIILLPTAYTILNSGRGSGGDNIDFSSLLIPNFKEILYKNYAIGITAIFLIALMGILLFKKLKRSDLFLTIATIILTIIPLVTYVLNGALYVRGKVLIPFILIYLLVLGLFIKYLFDNQINLKKFIISYIILNIIIFLTGYHKGYFYLDSIIAFILILCTLKWRKKILIYVPTLLILISINLGFNQNETYVTKSYYNDVNNSEIISLINKINQKDTSFYRTLNNNIEKDVVNKVYNNNYYQTTIYSSVYNNLYRDFYYQKIGNNIKYRNLLITAGSSNTLFNTLMGVKYIVGFSAPLGYEKIDSLNSTNLYYNKSAYPIIYVSKNLGSYDKYNELSFPYNIEYMLNNTVVASANETNYHTIINEYQISDIKSYSLDLPEDTNYNIKLDKSINNQILFIEFDMNYNESCAHADQFITINGVMNKLTCKTWLYHNGNNKFRYVISSNEPINDLNIQIGKGKYEITNIKTYIMDYNGTNNYINLDKLNIDKKSSTIRGSVNINENAYLVTSIPYDKGFKTYIDNREVSSEVVNNAFLGFKIESGNHEITIKYNSPWYKMGIILSLIGFIMMIVINIFECKKTRCLMMKFCKNKEIIMYLIFGVLTTAVSLCTYYLCTYTFLDASSDFELQIANVISWIVAVIFAYVTNRKYVFNSKNNNVKKEFVTFCKSRLLTLLLDMLFMFIFVSLLKFDDKIIKMIVQILIIISNYIFSKLLVFKGDL